jgi:hypothetical protein
MAAAPVLHCWASANLWQAGMGQVLISRQLHNGTVAFAVFLLDVYCRGVKNAMMGVAPRPIYERDVHERMSKQAPVVLIEPEYARKLVEGAVRYAADLGLPPHPDYRVAQYIFGDIDPELCTEEFCFGKNGKPLFMAGPFDDQTDCELVLNTLEERCGPGGYHYILPVPIEEEY